MCCGCEKQHTDRLELCYVQEMLKDYVRVKELHS